MIDSPVYKVLLPERILKQWSLIKNVMYMQLVMNYMGRYPHYSVNGVEDDFAVCSREIEYEQKRKKKR